MLQVEQLRPADEVLHLPKYGLTKADRMAIQEFRPLIDQAADEARRDPTGPELRVRVERAWSSKYEGCDKVLVYDQFSTAAHNLQEVHLRSSKGLAVVISIAGGSLIGYNRDVDPKPLCYQVREAISGLFKGTDRYFELAGLAPKGNFALDTMLTGPYLGRRAA